jgi:hypothetical protein
MMIKGLEPYQKPVNPIRMTPPYSAGSTGALGGNVATGVLIMSDSVFSLRKASQGSTKISQLSKFNCGKEWLHWSINSGASIDRFIKEIAKELDDPDLIAILQTYGEGTNVDDKTWVIADRHIREIQRILWQRWYDDCRSKPDARFRTAGTGQPQNWVNAPAWSTQPHTTCCMVPVQPEQQPRLCRGAGERRGWDGAGP